MKRGDLSLNDTLQEYLADSLSKLQIGGKGIRKPERPKKLTLRSRRVKTTSDFKDMSERGDFYGVALRQSSTQFFNCSRVLCSDV